MISKPMKDAIVAVVRAGGVRCSSCNTVTRAERQALTVHQDPYSAPGEGMLVEMLQACLGCGNTLRLIAQFRYNVQSVPRKSTKSN